LIEQILSYKTLFFDIGTTIYAFFSSDEQKPACHARKNLHQQGGPLFHSLYDGGVAGKMLPTQSIFHQPEQMEVIRCQIWTIQWVWYDSLAKIDNVLHDLQTGIGPGIITLQEKSCLLLCPDPGNSSLQLCQCRDVAVRVDGLCGFKKSKKITLFLSQKTFHITLPAEGSVFFFDGLFTCLHSMDCCFDSGS